MAAPTIDVANAVKTTKTASGSTHAASLPTVGLVNGDMMVVVAQIGTHVKTFSALAGWTIVDLGSPSGGSKQVVCYREIQSGTWTPGGSVTFTYDTGTDAARSQAFTVNGADMADFLNSSNVGGVRQASTDPMVLSANTLSGMGTDSLFVLVWGDESAARAIASEGLDTVLTLIGSESNYQHIAYEDVASAGGNSAISNNMASARDWDVGYFEIKAGAAAVNTVTLTDGVVLGDTAQSSVGDSLTDGVVLSDAPTARSDVKGALTDGVDLGDTAQSSVTDSLADGVVLGDAAVFPSANTGAATDGVTMGEGLGTVVTVTGTPTGLSLGDTAQASVGDSLTDGLVLSDAATAITAAAATTATDGVVLSDSAQADVGDSLADGISLSDALALMVAFGVSISDGVTLGDGSAAGSSFNGTLTDGAVFGDTALDSTTSAGFVALRDQLAHSVALSDRAAHVVDLRDGGAGSVVVADGG